MVHCMGFSGGMDHCLYIKCMGVVWPTEDIRIHDSIVQLKHSPQSENRSVEHLLCLSA